MNRSSILVVDQMPIFRSGVCELLRSTNRFDVSEAETPLQLVEALAADQFDVALIGLNPPPAAALHDVLARFRDSDAHAIVWSFEASAPAVIAAISAGASGFLQKTISAAGLMRALSALMRGEAPITRDAARLMIEGLHDLDDRLQARDAIARLSMRERDVLALIATGAANKAIGRELDISEFTVKRHVQNILRKLGIRSRHSAGAFYRTGFDADPAYLRDTTGLLASPARDGGMSSTAQAEIEVHAGVTDI